MLYLDLAWKMYLDEYKQANCMVELVVLGVSTKENICDAIKQNESEVSQVQFSFFWCTAWITCKGTFYNIPIDIGQLVTKIQAAERL